MVLLRYNLEFDSLHNMSLFIILDDLGYLWLLESVIIFHVIEGFTLAETIVVR